MDSRKMQSEREVKLSDIFYLILRRKWIILAILILFVIAGYFYTEKTYSPYYSATASFVVNTKTNQSYMGDTENPTSNDIYLAQKLVNTYTLILKSNRVMDYVIDKLDLDLTPEVLGSYVRLSSIEDTQILYLTVTCSDPELAVNVANAIIEVAPQAMMETVEIGSVNVLDKAAMPTMPKPLNALNNMATAALLGLALGIGLSVLFGLIIFKVKNSSDIEEKLTMPTLGEISHIGHEDRRNGFLLTSLDIPSSFIESYMMLGTIVRYVAANNKMKKLMITSSLGNEGKTLVSINLSLALIKSGKSVLLIDCDLRKQGVHKRLGISRNSVDDLYDVFGSVKNDADLEKCILKMSSGLNVIPFISPADKMDDIFASTAFNNAMNTLAKQYDYVIFDTAPAYNVTDTINLVGVIDGVIMVVRQEHVSLKIVSDSLNNLTRVGAKIIGCVLNDIRYHSIGSGYTYKYKHYYRMKYDYDNDTTFSVPDALKERTDEKNEKTLS